MVHFAKLKLYGFKSFVDKTELSIGPGLNGIVGPNGCGKSNLVEALRWVMGEKSAKNMRGGGMEDVIFAGTSKRPARNMAEVTVVMNNEDGTAPSPFDSATEIEINRRIEKDKGSQYRVNGKAVRARDVNLLFADTMTGASSPALVSQGRITEIITAKPEDRRRILEDSAGISGVHTRRHEAELRLRAAEQNLTRLHDSLNDMRSRLSSLKRQARQAERYKELSDAIRRLDMALSWCGWSKIHQKIRNDRQAFATANNTVQSALEEIKALTTQVETLETTLPDQRKKVMEAQAVLQNFRVSLERLEQDIKTKAKGLQDAMDAKTQLEQDNDFTQEQFTQILTDIETAQNDLAQTIAQNDQLPDQIQTAEANLAEIQTHYDRLLTQKQEKETALAVARESQANLEKQRDHLQSTADKLTSNINILTESLDVTVSKITELEASEILTNDLSAMEQAIDSLTQTIETNTKTLTIIEPDYQKAKQAKDAITSDINALRGELTGLETLLSSQADNDAMPQGDAALFNSVTVTGGYEKAVSAALGQWLMMAGIDKTALVHWAKTVATVTTPNGTKPLIDFVDVPHSLRPFLTAVGYVDILPDTHDLQAGQMIVSADGSFIRWDGLTVQAEAVAKTDQTGVILEQKNRVTALTQEIATKQTELDRLTQNLESLETQKAECEATLEDKRTLKTAKDNELREARYTHERITDQLTALREKQADQTSRLSQNTEELSQIQIQLTEIEAGLSTLTSQATISQKNAIEELTAQLSTLTIDLNTARQTLSDLKQTQQSGTNRVQALQNTIEKYQTEQAKLTARLDDFEKRQDMIEAKIRAYKTAEDHDTDAVREELLSKIADQETTLKGLQTQLENEDNTYRQRQTALREAESTAANAREHRATAQANVANAEEDLKRLEDEIRDLFELSPQALEERVFSLFNEQIPELTDLESEKDTITRQRDGIGPVNLRAAIECQETETHLAEMENEYDDLTKAIEQLRGGIAKLNREAKERLDIAFQRVNLHFQTLFTKLFEGGTAHLQMMQSDDPLDSGLEIFAQPPGKSLQKLSLLSGGEQTLTATALIFAMFLTNPSPICVLDEIDAPLDDANVDRVCTLMESIAQDTNTRFIVITHHRMTMARMDRLYGVTMSERGVSQLVSVDMALQEELELAETG